MAEPSSVVPQPRGPGRSALPKSRALVIGGGVEGVCSAYYLVRAGWDVTLVEKPLVEVTALKPERFG